MKAKGDAVTLTKAVVAAAERLGVPEALPHILGIPTESVARLKSGDDALEVDTEAWHAATRFASLYRSLITLVGSVERARAWLNDAHQTLGATPAELLRTQGGLERVVRYLDAVQKYEIKLPPRSH